MSQYNKDAYNFQTIRKGKVIVSIIATVYMPNGKIADQRVFAVPIGTPSQTVITAARIWAHKVNYVTKRRIADEARALIDAVKVAAEREAERQAELERRAKANRIHIERAGKDVQHVVRTFGNTSVMWDSYTNVYGDVARCPWP